MVIANFYLETARNIPADWKLHTYPRYWEVHAYPTYWEVHAFPVYGEVLAYPTYLEIYYGLYLSRQLNYVHLIRFPQHYCGR